MTVCHVFAFAVAGYVASVLIEGPILWAGLSRRHTSGLRLRAAVVLTALTYPMVALVLPALFAKADINSRTAFLAVAETWAVVAEVIFFRMLTGQPVLTPLDRDAWVIAAANAASFLAGEVGLSVFLHEWIESALGVVPRHIL